MAKHKKKRAKKISKGLRPSVNSTTLRLVRADRTEGDKIMNKLLAWRAGKKGFVTIANPNNDPSRQFIKVSFDAYFGGGRDYKTIKFGDKKKVSDDNRIEA